MNARRETQIPIGPLIAAIGAVLLIVSLGLDWYGEISGFNSFEFLDLLLVLLALVTLTVLVEELGLVRIPLKEGTPLVIGVIALVVVLTQLVNRPPLAINLDVETGLWLGLAGAALMLLGAILATARIAIAVEPRRSGTTASRPAESPPASSKPPDDQAPTVVDEPRP